MIYQLLSFIKAELEAGLADLVPANHILQGQPESPPTAPYIVLDTSLVKISHVAIGSQNSAPRPQDHLEDRTVDVDSPAGPYRLEKQPIENAVSCQLIYDRGELSERKELLFQKEDFEITHAQNGMNLTFSKDVSAASHFILKYSFVGVFTIRDFTQDFFVEVFVNDSATMSMLGSLCATIILTNLSELQNSYNLGPTNTFVSEAYTSLYTINSIQFLGAEKLPEANPEKMQIQFTTKGQMKAIKSISGGFGFIEKVKSPGNDSDFPVDINIGID